MENGIQSVWPQWQPVRLLGEGSFGKVFEAVTMENGEEKHCAVKVIPIPQNFSEVQSLYHDGMTEDEITMYYGDLVNEFSREILLMRELKDHPHIVHYEDYAIVERKERFGWDVYIRMELLTSLPNVMELRYGGTLPDDQIERLSMDLCSALEACAEKRIVHRDIKPDNIFVSADGTYKLGDFGVARTIEKTVSGLSKKGTYTYMAPEIYKGEPSGLNVDVYSLGIVLYKLLNHNREPFLPPVDQPMRYEDKHNAVLRRMSGEPFPPPAGGTAALRRIIDRACAFDPHQRYASPTEMKCDLQRAFFRDTISDTAAVYAASTPPSSSSSSRVGLWIALIVTVALAVIAVVLWQLWPTDEEESPRDAKDTVATVLDDEQTTVATLTTAASLPIDVDEGYDAIYVSNTPTVYEVGDTFDADATELYGVYPDGKQGPIDIHRCSIEGFDTSQAGECVVTIHYGDLSTSFTVMVVNPAPTLPSTVPRPTVPTSTEVEEDCVFLGTWTAESESFSFTEITFYSDSTAVLQPGNIRLSYSYTDTRLSLTSESSVINGEYFVAIDSILIITDDSEYITLTKKN